MGANDGERAFATQLREFVMTHDASHPADPVGRRGRQDQARVAISLRLGDRQRPGGLAPGDRGAGFRVDTRRAHAASASLSVQGGYVDGIDQDQSGPLVKARPRSHLCALPDNPQNG